MASSAIAVDGAGGAPLAPTPSVVTRTTVTPVRARANAPPAPPAVVSSVDDGSTPAASAALQTAAPSNTPLLSSYLFTANVFVNNVDIGPPISFEVSRNSYNQGDKYYTELALAAMPNGYGKPFWSDGDQKTVEIRCGQDQAPQKSLIVGLIDDCEIDWLTNVLKLRGRDLSSLLTDNKTAEKFANMTSAQVAKLIATRRGLSSVVGNTSTLIGTYYQREHAKLTDEITEHALLTFLAEQEGFLYWVEGRTLHFEAPAATAAKPFVVYYTPPTPNSVAAGNFIQLTTKRNETLAKDIEVKVLSYDGKKKKQIIGSAKRVRVKAVSKVTKNTAGGGGGSEQQVYTYHIPGLSQAAADDRAQALLKTISSHERNLRIEMPFDPALNARSRLSLRNTGTAFDQAYYVDSVEYSASYASGSRMEINARNTSPGVQALAAQPTAADLTKPTPPVAPAQPNPPNPAVAYFGGGA